MNAYKSPFQSTSYEARGTFFGLFIWLAALLFFDLRLESAILLFAPLVLTPLALYLLPMSESGTWQWYVREAALILQLPCAALLALSYDVRTGTPAVLCALPWLAYTLLLAAWGVSHGIDAVRTVPRAAWIRESAVVAGLIFPVVAGAAIVMFHLGRWPFGFPAQIIELTGVHFHYAGLVLPMLLYRAAMARPGTITNLAVVGGIIGIPLVGLGITFSPALEIAAVALLVPACLLLAITHLRLAAAATRPTTSMLFAVSGVCLLGGMALALIYAVGEYRPQIWPDIPTMIRLHGVTNAFGFALLGLLAWHSQDAKAK